VTMSSNSTLRSLVLLTVFVLSIGLIGSEAGASGQENQNTGDTSQNSNISNANTTTKKTSSKGSKKHKHKANANTSTSSTDNSAMTGADQTGATATQTTGATSSKAAGESHDLSGTYAGVVNYPEGGLTGPATLTITGTDFTLTPEGGTPVTGRVSAVKTGGYTGVAMQMGQVAPSTAAQPATTPPATVSLRVRRSGDRLSLTSIPGSAQKFSFTPASTARKGSRRKSSKTPAPETTTPGAESTTPTGEETGAPATAPKSGNRNTNANTGMNSNTNNTNSTEPANSNNSNTP
jgi:hypothetical protein